MSSVNSINIICVGTEYKIIATVNPNNVIKLNLGQLVSTGGITNIQNLISQDEENKLKLGSDNKLLVLNEFETTQW